MLFSGAVTPLFSSLELSTSLQESLGRRLLQSLLNWLESGVIHPTNTQEAREFNGLRQSLRNCCHESSAALLSPELYGLALQYLHNPIFGEFAERLLQIISESNLTHAALAAERLSILKGEGSLFQQIQNTALRIHRSGELPATALSMMGAGLVGRSIGCYVSAGLRGSRLGLWSRSLLSAGSSLMVEASVFHPLHQSALWTMGRNVAIFSGYTEHWADSLGLMAALRFGGAASTFGRHAFHGTQVINSVSMATRFRGLSLITSKVAPVLGESSALMGLGFWNGEGIPNQIIANALGLMVESRLASGLGHAFAPRSHYLQNRLQEQTYQNLRQQVRHAMARLSSKVSSQPWHSAQEIAAQGVGPREVAPWQSANQTNPLSQLIFRVGETELLARDVNELRRQFGFHDERLVSSKEIYPKSLVVTGEEINGDLGHLYKHKTPYGTSATAIHTGTKTPQQDAFAQGLTSNEVLWFSLYDGMSTPGDGAQAAGIAARNTAVAMDNPRNTLSEAYNRAQNRLAFEARGNGTTAAGYEIFQRNGEHWIRITHVGDSSIVVLQIVGGRWQVLHQTKPHSFAQLAQDLSKVSWNDQMEFVDKFKTNNAGLAYELVKAGKAFSYEYVDPNLMWNSLNCSQLLHRFLSSEAVERIGFADMEGVPAFQPDIMEMKLPERAVVLSFTDGMENLSVREMIKIMSDKTVDQAALDISVENLLRQQNIVSLGRKVNQGWLKWHKRFQVHILRRRILRFGDFYYEFNRRGELTNKVYRKNDQGQYELIHCLHWDNQTFHINLFDPDNKFSDIIPNPTSLAH